MAVSSNDKMPLLEDTACNVFNKYSISIVVFTVYLERRLPVIIAADRRNLSVKIRVKIRNDVCWNRTRRCSP